MIQKKSRFKKEVERSFIQIDWKLARIKCSSRFNLVQFLMKLNTKYTSETVGIDKNRICHYLKSETMDVF